MNFKELAEIMDNLIALATEVESNHRDLDGHTTRHYLCAHHADEACTILHIPCSECIFYYPNKLEKLQGVTKKLRALALLEE